MADQTSRTINRNPYDLEVPKPAPLRIIKQTKASSTEVMSNGLPQRRIFKSSAASESLDQPKDYLTICKTRQAGGSTGHTFINGHDDQVMITSSNQVNYPTSLQPDNAIIDEFASTSSRNSSTGSVIRNTFFSKSVDSGINNAYQEELTVPEMTKSSFPSDQVSSSQDLESVESKEEPPEVSKGRMSIGKKLVRKAFNNSTVAKRTPTPFPTTKQSLLRRLSLKSFRQPSTSSISSSVSLVQPSAPEDPNDSADGRRDSRGSLETQSTSLNSSCVLCPTISVVCEYESVDSSQSISVWSAILITCELHNAGDSASSSKKHENSSTGDIDHGYLYGLTIRIFAGPGCFLEDSCGAIRDSRRLRPGESELILARVKIPSLQTSSQHSRISSEQLITELESHLGSSATDFLCVKVSYQSSAYPSFKQPDAQTSNLTSNETTLKTETHFSIQRSSDMSLFTHCYPGPPYPLNNIVKMHYEPYRAQEIIRRMYRPREEMPSSAVYSQRMQRDGTASCENVAAGNLTPPEASTLRHTVSLDDGTPTPTSKAHTINPDVYQDRGLYQLANKATAASTASPQTALRRPDPDDSYFSPVNPSEWPNSDWVPSAAFASPQTHPRRPNPGGSYFSPVDPFEWVSSDWVSVPGIYKQQDYDKDYDFTSDYESDYEHHPNQPLTTSMSSSTLCLPPPLALPHSQSTPHLGYHDIQNDNGDINSTSNHNAGPGSDPDTDPDTETETDPARKIWTEIRRSSRSSVGNGLLSRRRSRLLNSDENSKPQSTLDQHHHVQRIEVQERERTGQDENRNPFSNLNGDSKRHTYHPPNHHPDYTNHQKTHSLRRHARNGKQNDKRHPLEPIEAERMMSMGMGRDMSSSMGMSISKLRDMALKNKRSVGLESLRSLVVPFMANGMGDSFGQVVDPSVRRMGGGDVRLESDDVRNEKNVLRKGHESLRNGSESGSTSASSASASGSWSWGPPWW